MGKQIIKCVVWDLDNTLWDGVLAETDDVVLKNNIVPIIKELDRRGILQSISSKNEHDNVMKKLDEFGIKEYFLYPQVNWGSKSESIKAIQKAFNFGIDTFAFVDDQAFEREEVAYSIPEVLCIDAADIDKLLDMEQMQPRFVTEDSKNRRKLYMNDIERNKAEEKFEGAEEDFLATLGIKFTISKAKEIDLKRMEELTVRTHQLNSTGTVYSYEELLELIHSDKYDVIVAQLDDKYGEYGKIGIAVVEKNGNDWEIKLLLMSCRVMSKGVGSVMLRYITNNALKHKANLYADFVQTDRNRIMYITYKFSKYKEVEKNGKYIRLQSTTETLEPYPSYVTVVENI